MLDLQIIAPVHWFQNSNHLPCFFINRAHEAANAARKLTPQARREKTIRKLKEDTSLGVHVALFRVTELKNPQRKYKVDINAQQLYLTGMYLHFVSNRSSRT